MEEPDSDRKIHIRVPEDLHKRLRIKCAELDTTIQAYVTEMLRRDLFADIEASLSTARSTSRGGSRPIVR